MPDKTKPAPVSEQASTPQGTAPITHPESNNAPKSKAATKTAKPAAKQVRISDIKPGKVKTVRGNYALPKDEYALLAKNKERCLKAGVRVKKSELLRAGLLYISQLPDVELIAAVVKIDEVRLVAEKSPKKNAAKAAKPKTEPAKSVQTKPAKTKEAKPAQAKPAAAAAKKPTGE